MGALEEKSIFKWFTNFFKHLYNLEKFYFLRVLRFDDHFSSTKLILCQTNKQSNFVIRLALRKKEGEKNGAKFTRKKRERNKHAIMAFSMEMALKHKNFFTKKYYI